MTISVSRMRRVGPRSTSRDAGAMNVITADAQTLTGPAVGTVDVPHADVVGVYYTDWGGEVRLSSDPRELVRPGMSLDPRAVFSLLRFGAVVPPLTPWREIRRLAPGYRFHLPSGSAPERVSPLPLEAPAVPPGSSLEEHADAVTLILDRQIAEVERPAVLFSGGVDSGLIAARFAAAGRRDALLINYGFGEKDPESTLAEEMAARLGLRFERVLDNSDDLTSSLDRPGAVYPLPFGDHSTVPTAALARAVIDRYGGAGLTLLDGTGADGGFGMSGKVRSWGRLQHIPRLLRLAAASLYVLGGCWTRTGAAEHRLRVLRRAATMPLLSAVVAQNPLAGMLYDARYAADVDRLLAEWIGGWPLANRGQRIVAADLAMTCANIFVQKARPVFAARQFEVRYPFLSPEFVGLGVRSVNDQPHDEPKAALKLALSRSVPADMVYRPKSGFVDPFSAVFRSHRFLEFLTEAGSLAAPLAGLVSGKYLRRAAELLASGRKLPPQTLNCLWAIVFLDRWLRTLPSAPEPRRSAAFENPSRRRPPEFKPVEIGISAGSAEPPCQT